MTLTAQQIEMRRHGLGGTDVAAIFGETGRRSAIDVFKDKVGEGDPFDGNRRTRMGTRLEPVVAQMYAEEAKVITLSSNPLTLQHPDRDWHIGSPDRVVMDCDDYRNPVGDYPDGMVWNRHCEGPRPIGGLEIKTHGFFGSQDYAAELRDGGAEDVVRLGAEHGGRDTIPGPVRIQIAWYQALLDLDQYHLAALLDTHLLGIVDVPRDKEFEADLLTEAERFWKQNVLAHVEPEADGSASFKKHLAAKFKTHNAEMIDVDDAASWLIQHREASAIIKEATATKDEASNRLRAIIGNNMGVKTSGSGKATWKEQKGKLSYKTVAEEIADDHNMSEEDFEARKDASRGEPTRVLRVSKK